MKTTLRDRILLVYVWLCNNMLHFNEVLGLSEHLNVFQFLWGKKRVFVLNSNGVSVFKICRIYFCEDLCVWVGFFKEWLLSFLFTKWTWCGITSYFFFSAVFLAQDRSAPNYASKIYQKSFWLILTLSLSLKDLILHKEKQSLLHICHHWSQVMLNLTWNYPY